MPWFSHRLANEPRRPLVTSAAPAEIMEARALLAGNVSATLIDGVLTLSGDRRSNDLTVQIDAEGAVTFSSVGTTVNGQTAAEVQLEGTVTAITGSFGRGRDRVVIEGVVDSSDDAALPTISGDIVINMGRGRDQLTIRGFDVGGELVASGGRHRDSVTIEAVNVGDDGVRISGGRGRDTLAVRDVNVDGDVAISGGRGRDRMVMGDDVTVGGSSTVSGGKGRDRFVEAPETPPDETTETAAETAARESQQAAVDAYFATPPIDASLVSAFDRSLDDDTDGGESSEPETPVDPFPENSLDTVTFINDFPAIDASQFETSDSGLRFRIVEPGNNIRPLTNDSITIAYQGLLLNGTEFDSSSSSTFQLSNLIGGLREGVPLIGEGGRIQLLIPPDLAYGTTGTSTGSVPPNATIFFNVELFDVN